MSISVVLADEQPVVRLGLRQALESLADMTVVGEASDGLETVRIVEQLGPDVLVLDLLLSGLSGMDVLPLVRQRSPRTRSVVFSAQSDEKSVLHAIRSGAIGYVLKRSDPGEVVEAIRRAVAGRIFLGDQLADRAAELYCATTDIETDPHDFLTPREREVLQLAAEGNTGPDIAQRLAISIRTVEMHRGNAMKKLHLHSRFDLMRYAVRRGMVSPE